MGGGCKAEGGCVKTEGKERSVWQLQEEEIGLWNSGKKEGFHSGMAERVEGFHSRTA